MSNFNELMRETTEMVLHITAHFILARNASGIQREEVLHTDKITSALDYLRNAETPTVSNANAMEYLAEMLTLVKCEREAVRNFTAMDDEHRDEFFSWCDTAILGMRVLAVID